MDYYKKKQNIALLHKNGKIKTQMERWEAHEKGLLHRAFTVAIVYKGKYVIQHRKHPVFDDIYDVTSSSHPMYENKELQNMEEAVVNSLLREWGLKRKDYGDILDKGSVYYKSKDPKSKYTEHENCEIFEVEVKKIPKANKEYAYGELMVTKKELRNKSSKFYKKLAPWVIASIEKNLL